MARHEVYSRLYNWTCKTIPLPPQTIQHHKLEFDGRYIGHPIVSYDGYDNDNRLLVYDTENLKFLDEYNLDEYLGWTGDELSPL